MYVPGIKRILVFCSVILGKMLECQKVFLCAMSNSLNQTCYAVLQAPGINSHVLQVQHPTRAPVPRPGGYQLCQLLHQEQDRHHTGHDGLSLR